MIETLEDFSRRRADRARAIAHVVLHGLDVPAKFMRDLFDGSIALAESNAGRHPCRMTIYAAQSIGMTKVMIRIGVGDRHEVPHDFYDFVRFQKRIGARAVLGGDPLIRTEGFIRGDAQLNGALNNGKSGKNWAQVVVPRAAELAPAPVDRALVKAETNLQLRDRTRVQEAFEGRDNELCVREKAEIGNDERDGFTRVWACHSVGRNF